MNLTYIDFQSENAGKLITESLKNLGFAVIINHTVDQELINKNFLQWKRFFSSNEKRNYAYNGTSLDGYFDYGIEQAKKNKKADPKEYFYFYKEGRCPDYLKDYTLALFTKLVEVGTFIAREIDKHLPEEVKAGLSMPLERMLENSNKTVLRVLHYPSLKENVECDQIDPDHFIRAAAHEDLTLLAMISQLTSDGLEVRDVTGEWHQIPWGPDKLVINVGDMLQMATGGYLKATTHRVIVDSRNKESRYANAFFLMPRDEVRLDGKHIVADCLAQHIAKKLKVKSGE